MGDRCRWCKDRDRYIDEAERLLERCEQPHRNGVWRCEGVRGHEGEHQALRHLERWP